jgi:hypothetical protein
MLQMPGAHYTVVVAGNDHREQARQIRAARPNAMILLRPYWGDHNVFTNDPIQVADRCIELLGDLVPGVSRDVVIGNEPNVESPGFNQNDNDHWSTAGLWLEVANKRARERLPDAILHLCPASPGCGDDPALIGGGGQRLWHGAAAVCDRIDGHVYWGRGKQLDPYYGLRHLYFLRQIYTGRDMYLSECGPVDVRDQGAAASEIREWHRRQLMLPWVSGYALFSWWWGGNHPEFNYADKPALLDSLRVTMAEEGTEVAKFTVGPWFTSHEGWVVTRPFGYEDPAYADGWHKGTDLARPGTTGTKGALVLAPFDGKVDFVWHREDRGWEVYIYDPKQGVEFCIYHLLMEPNLRAGDDVAMGQVIGHVGDTGALSTGAHAHVGLVKTFSKPPYNIDERVGRKGWVDLYGPDVIRAWEV